MPAIRPSSILLLAALSLACAHSSDHRPIHEERFVSIGGIEQWITIDGENRGNPVVLFLHGGPGNTLSPFAHSIYGGWTGEFTLVQWDQRAAGMTWGRNPPPEDSPLTIDRMTRDGIMLAEYLAQYLGKEKILLLGGSWGSVLGVHMIQARPDLFHAYVGTSQLVSKVENQAASYAAVMAAAREAGDQNTITALETIGPPPWKNPRHPGALRRATRVYEARTTDPAPPSWWIRSPQYAAQASMADYEAGEDYSYLQFVGLEGEGMLSAVDLPQLGLTFEVPVCLIQGAEDLVTVKEVAERYFERIEAPGKRFIVVPRAGHDPNEAVVDAQYRALKDCGRVESPADIPSLWHSARVSLDEAREILRAALELAVVDGRLGGLSERPLRIPILATGVGAIPLPAFDDVEFFLASPEELQRLANESDRYIHFLDIRGAWREGDSVFVLIDRLPKYPEGTTFASAYGGGITAELRRTADGWQGSVRRAWVE